MRAPLAAVHVSSWRIAYRGVFPDAAIVADTERRREAWRRYIEQPVTPEQRLLVATSSGAVVGFAAFGPSRDDDAGEGAVGEVYATYVEPRLWRQGVGRALLAEAERLLRADGFAEETLWVLPDSDHPVLNGRRWDDPNGEYPTLYCGTDRQTVFAETIAQFRLRPGLRDRILRETDEDAPDPHYDFDEPEGRVPPGYFGRALGHVLVEEEARFIDVDDVENTTS